MLRKIVMLVIGLLLASPAGASGLAPLPAVAPVRGCASLAGVDVSSATGAATTLAAQEVAGEHPYCQVTGTIAPTIHFEVRLPLQGWTQRFLETGCGGLCGMLRIDAGKAEGCAPVTDGSIALASTDMGHQGMDGAWGEDKQKRADFAYRGVHVTVLAARALIAAFYGQAPRYAYFAGCSDGGREALIEAQRYPNDFDGIAAGAPALNFTVQNSFHHGWLARANTGADGKPLLTAVDMKPLHAAVLAACDGLDGLIDGQITDPRACHVDPAVVQCKGAYEAGVCLGAEQVEAVRKIYQGARSPDGKALEVGPLMPGSEEQWIGVFVPIDRDKPIGSAMMALGTINHLLFTPNRTYTIADFPFTAAMYAQEEPARALYSADDANLAPFAAHGGKLILWHGWADPHISPLNTIDYYERVGRQMGAAQREAFTRLFLFPGMGHCSGGDGPSEFPLLASLMAWVEGGEAPHMMIAHRAQANAEGLPTPPNGQRPPQGMGGPPPGMAPPRAVLPPRSRPVYAYPAVAVYTGKGSVEDAASFTATTPQPVKGISNWIGAR